MNRLLFDMDGVLVDSLDVYRDAWTRWATGYAVPGAAIEADVHGRRPGEVIARVLPAGAALGPALADFDAMLDAAAPRVVPFPGASALTAGLVAGSWAIVTSGSRRHVLAMLDSAAIAMPSVLVCGGDIDRGKPDPACYLRAAELLGAAPGDCLVVEDAPAGIQAAVAAGMPSVGVLTTHRAEALAGAREVFVSLQAASDYLLAFVGDPAR